jgi:hypothetical protein
MAKKRVKCDRCGLEYDEGAPHMMFCRGAIPEDAECVSCGQDDPAFLLECSSCGEVVCECCMEDGTHTC